MERTWKPVVAGIIEILVVVLTVSLLVWASMTPDAYEVWIGGLFFISMVVLGFVGGICALRRRRYGWALAGAMAVSCGIIGIPAWVLIALSKKEFRQPDMAVSRSNNIPKTWKPRVAGILDLVIGGAISVLALVFLVVGIVGSHEGNIWGPLGILMLPPGALAVVGGICALRRRNWRLAIVCPMFAVPFFGLTIPAIIFVAQSKKEFA